MNGHAMPLAVSHEDVRWFLSHPGTSEDEIRKWRQNGDIELVERDRL